MASGFRGSASPIAEALERENTGPTDEYLIHSRKEKYALRDPPLGYRPSLETISEYGTIQPGLRRSAPTVSIGPVDFSFDSTFTTSSSSSPATTSSSSSVDAMSSSSSVDATSSSRSAAATSFKWRASKIPIPSSQSSPTHETQSEVRYFCRNGRGKRPIVSSVSRQISLMSGMSAQVYHVDPNPLDSSSPQSPGSCESSHSKRSSQQQQQQQQRQQRQQNEKELKQQKQHQQQQQTQQQNLKQDSCAVDPFAAHYSTSHDRIIRPSPISYHHFKLSPEIVHEPQLRRSPSKSPKTTKSVSFNLPSQSESQISQRSASKIPSSPSSPSLPLTNPPSNSSSHALSSPSSPSALPCPKSEASSTFRPFITHPRGMVTQLDFPLYRNPELPERSSQNTLDTSRSTSPRSTAWELLPSRSPYAAATFVPTPAAGTKPSLASHQIDIMEILNEDEIQNEALLPSPMASYPISQPTPFLKNRAPTEYQSPSHPQWKSETILESSTHLRRSATLPLVFPLDPDSILDAVLAAGDGDGTSAGASASATAGNSGTSMSIHTNMNVGSNIASVSNFPFTTIPSGPVFLNPNAGLGWESEIANDGSPGPHATLNVEATAASAEDRQARNRSFGQRLRDTFLFKSKKRK
ncbi:hypothetical protein BGX26_003142 [Mortierella sp. AD094]|nr:hypothetical protein BGX26_003142 [Mortierella sp. AD094]